MVSAEMTEDGGSEVRLRAEALRSLSLQDLEYLEVPEITWLVAGLVPRGALALLVGRPKAGKSLLAIDLLASVASGASFLGRATESGPAVYVAAEDAPALVRERIFARLGAERGAPLRVVPADGSLDQVVRIDQKAGLARLAATVVDLEARLVVLDPFRELHHQAENEAEPMAAILRPLRQLAHQANCAIVLVHHRNKHATDPALATRGSSAIAGSVDVTITLDAGGETGELGENHLLSLRVEGRYGPRQKLGARLGKGLRWMPVALDEGMDQSADGRILRHLGKRGEGLTSNELALDLGLATKTVQNALARLRQAREVFRDGKGIKEDPYRYRARGAAPDAPAVCQPAFEPF